MQPARGRVFRHQSPQLEFELVFAEPAPALRRYAHAYVGWFDCSPFPLCRLELPTGVVPLILNFDSVVRERKAASDSWNTFGIFTSGLHVVHIGGIRRSRSRAAGQPDSTRCTLFVNRPLRDFTNRSVELDDVLGASADLLAARLYNAPRWDDRFDILDREIESRIQSARQPAAVLEWAWRRLITTHGTVRIAHLLKATSWSERHFASQFSEQFGLTPKVFARVLRFRRAVKLMMDSPSSNLTDVAQSCGYFDHAHFTREFREFAGVAPSVLLRMCLPEHAGFDADYSRRKS